MSTTEALDPAASLHPILAQTTSGSSTEASGTSKEHEGEALQDISTSTVPDHTYLECTPKLDKISIEKLCVGMLGNILPELQKSKSTLEEVTNNQRILIETVLQENAKFGECEALTEVENAMDKAKQYQVKLIRIKKEMIMLHEKSAKLKKRALKIQQRRQKEELQREQEKERELEKERQLVAKPAKKT